MTTFPHAINADNMGSLDFNLHSLMSKWIESERHSVLSEPLQLHGLYNPGTSPGQNTGVGSHSLLQGIFPTQGLNPGLPCCRHILTSWATREAQEYWSGQPFPSPGDLPDLGIEPGSPALQANSLPAELSGKLLVTHKCTYKLNWFSANFPR